MKLGVLGGASAQLPEDVIEDWAKRLPDLMKDIYYCALPCHSMVVKSDPRRGLKTAKERITALIAASARDVKLKPLVIGKSVKPRCFAGIKLSLLPVNTEQTNVCGWHLHCGRSGWNV